MASILVLSIDRRSLRSSSSERSRQVARSSRLSMNSLVTKTYMTLSDIVMTVRSHTSKGP